VVVVLLLPRAEHSVWLLHAGLHVALGTAPGVRDTAMQNRCCIFEHVSKRNPHSWVGTGCVAVNAGEGGRA
jgi:hypothetical protein